MVIYSENLSRAYTEILVETIKYSSQIRFFSFFFLGKNLFSQNIKKQRL